MADRVALMMDGVIQQVAPPREIYAPIPSICGWPASSVRHRSTHCRHGSMMRGLGDRHACDDATEPRRHVRQLHLRQSVRRPLQIADADTALVAGRITRIGISGCGGHPLRQTGSAGPPGGADRVVHPEEIDHLATGDTIGLTARPETLLLFDFRRRPHPLSGGACQSGSAPCLPSCRWGVKSMADRAPAISAAPAKQAAPRTGPSRTKAPLRDLSDGDCLATPATALMLALLIGPSLAVGFLSLTDWGFGARQLRLHRARQLCRDDRRSGFSGGSLINTLVYVGVVMPVSVGAGARTWRCSYRVDASGVPSSAPPIFLPGRLDAGRHGDGLAIHAPSQSPRPGQRDAAPRRAGGRTG